MNTKDAKMADQERVTQAINKATVLLEKTIIDLILTEPFFAHVLMGMRKEFTTSIATAGVNVTSQVNLYANPFFFCALAPLERKDLVKHEVYHVLHNHFVRFRDAEKELVKKDKWTIVDNYSYKEKHEHFNIAADAAINQYLPNLAKEFRLFNADGSVLTVPTEIEDADGNKIPNPSPRAGQLETGTAVSLEYLQKIIPDIRALETTEYYYARIRDHAEKNPMPITIGIDDHSLWEQGGYEDTDRITQKVCELVNDAREKTPAGKIPINIRSAIEALNHVPRDWRQDIQRFSARCSETLVESTRKRRNRRYGILYPGTKIFPKLKLVAALDTSASVSVDELAQFHAELCRLHALGVTLTIIECDAAVHNTPYTFDPKKPFEIHGGGGTAFAPVFEYIKTNKLEVDGLIYFTDGGCSDSELKRPSYPVLWALTPPFTLPDFIQFGAKTKIEVSKK